METEIYNKKGETVGKLELPESVFGLPWNADLVHQVVESERANQRQVLAHAKNRYIPKAAASKAPTCLYNDAIAKRKPAEKSEI